MELLDRSIDHDSIEIIRQYVDIDILFAKKIYIISETFIKRIDRLSDRNHVRWLIDVLLVKTWDLFDYYCDHKSRAMLNMQWQIRNTIGLLLL